MSDALDRVIEALAGLSEDEVAAVLSEVAVPRPRPSAPPISPLTPLPLPGPPSRIVSEVEWIQALDDVAGL